MDESADTTKPNPEPPTPDVAQLIKLIDLQTAAQRERRALMPRALQGTSFRYGSLIVIVVFTLGSVWLMEYIISQLPKPGQTFDTGLKPAIPAALVGKNASPTPGVKGQSSF